MGQAPPCCRAGARPFGGPQGSGQPRRHRFRRPFGVGAIGLGVVLVFTDLLPLSGVGTGLGVAVGGMTVLVTMAYSIRESRRVEKAGENEGQDAG